MDNHVAWQVELAVKPGKLEHFRELTAEMVAATRAEPGVLNYERFVSADGSAVHIHERYTDSAAAVAHLRMFGETFSGRFVGMVDRTRFTVYGTPSEELREILDGFGATYLTFFGGFSR
jgi:quinol monooxygenase YgiN